MYATAKFDFDQGKNGWLMAEFAFMRSIFLIFMFPRIISLGRSWTTRKTKSSPAQGSRENGATVQPEQLPTTPGEFDAAPGEQSETEPIKPPQGEGHGSSWYVFDLIFLRWSLVVDGAFTTVAAFATQSWHIYLGMCPVTCSRRRSNSGSRLSSALWIRLRSCCQGCHHRNVP